MQWIRRATARNKRNQIWCPGGMDEDDESRTMATRGHGGGGKAEDDDWVLSRWRSGRKAGARVLHHWVADAGCSAAGLRGLAA
jgi:hypothetical protein